MGRKAKHKWTLDEFIDSARDHIGHMLDNMGVRDIVYVACWISGTILIYNTVTGIKKISMFPTEFLTSYRGQLTESQKSTLNEIDWNIFMLSMIGSYGLLKIDVSDVAAAVSKLQSAITTAGAGIAA